jgi:hypothetical protein
MDLIQTAFDLCVKIHDMHGTFKSNQESCVWLSNRVNIIQHTLEQQLQRHAIPSELFDALQCLNQVRLDS